MPTAAKLNIAVTAQVDQANTALRQVQGQVQTTGGAVVNALTKMEVSGKAFKRGMKEVGYAVGSSGAGGEFAGAAASMMMMGPAIGGAMAALHIYNSAMEKSAARTKVLEDSTAAYGEALKVLGQIQGKIHPDVGGFSSQGEKEIKGAQAKIDALEKEMKDNFKSPFALLFEKGETAKLQAEIDRWRDYQRTLSEVALTTDVASEAQKKLARDMTAIQMGTTKEGSQDRLTANMDATRDAMQILNETMQKLPREGTKFLEIQDAWNANYIKLIGYQNQLNELQRKATEEEEKGREEEMKQYFVDEAKVDAEAKKVRDYWSNINDQISKTLEDENEAARQEIYKQEDTDLKKFFDEKQGGKHDVGSAEFANSLINLDSLANASGKADKEEWSKQTVSQLEMLRQEMKDRDMRKAPARASG